MRNELRVGLIVMHPKKPEWGPGRILDLRAGQATVYFRDIPGDDANAAVRTLDLQYTSLHPAEVQSDILLDNLPPYQDGRFVRATPKRVTIEQALANFHAIFPLYFEDPAYIGEVGRSPSARLVQPSGPSRRFSPIWAQPDRFMFLKPEVTQQCAARLTFDLAYSSDLNWPTYERLLVMSARLLEILRPYGASDFIDVQSFIWVIGAY